MHFARNNYVCYAYMNQSFTMTYDFIFYYLGYEDIFWTHDVSQMSHNICNTEFSPKNLATDGVLVKCELDYDYGDILPEIFDGDR